ncbi:chemotaxis protein CheW [Marinobacterium arenosum]|uniref:chemotaxis protein CheW n=1 Tax=Marinobacterium arenosum TaxID=2862496 RepID=UPI001C95A9F4|nr:hypothetical protein [Marinobacterium arenosum]MBY4675970.1 hypothetical protein [Marinobacterium arenosum]
MSDTKMNNGQRLVQDYLDSLLQEAEPELDLLEEMVMADLAEPLDEDPQLDQPSQAEQPQEVAAEEVPAESCAETELTAEPLAEAESGFAAVEDAIGLPECAEHVEVATAGDCDAVLEEFDTVDSEPLAEPEEIPSLADTAPLAESPAAELPELSVETDLAAPVEQLAAATSEPVPEVPESLAAEDVLEALESIEPPEPIDATELLTISEPLPVELSAADEPVVPVEPAAVAEQPAVTDISLADFDEESLVAADAEFQLELPELPTEDQELLADTVVIEQAIDTAEPEAIQLSEEDLALLDQMVPALDDDGLPQLTESERLEAEADAAMLAAAEAAVAESPVEPAAPLEPPVPVAPALPVGEKPAWAGDELNCVMVTVYGINVAIPMEHIQSATSIEKVSLRMELEHDWILGQIVKNDHTLTYVLDSAHWLMPELYDAEKCSYQDMVVLDGGYWALACDEMTRSVRIPCSSVAWSVDRSRRPWLLGTCMAERCAILDVDALISQLNSAL